MIRAKTLAIDESRTRFPLGPAADAIIVLGGGVRFDGTLTAVSRARVERALEPVKLSLLPRIRLRVVNPPLAS